MNAILGFGQLLEFSQLTEAQRDNLGYIMGSGRHLLNLINDVLEVSRVECGTTSVFLERVSLGDILHECVDLMQPMAKAHDVSLELADPSSSFVSADQQRLRQVVLNILSNAIKYNKRGGRVSISASELVEGWVSVHVLDTGPGISVEMQTRLYTPFDRLGAEALGIEGTGLGLSLSKALIEAMGGTITVQSEEGSGSCFTVTLSRIDPKSPRTVEPSDTARSVGETPVCKVLLIEDNPINRELMTRIFSKSSLIRLLSATSGESGLEMALEDPPDLVLLDLHLPGMSGRDVLRQLRSEPELKDVPVIIVSADAFLNQRELLLSEGAFRYVTKPIDVPELIRAVDAALASRSSE
jgi:CheY-like chemotaxis protein